jgi:malonyl-CoA/methylmalonyl-CoA synthetase
MDSQRNGNLFDVFCSRFPTDLSTTLLLAGEDEEYTYADLLCESARMANYLVTLGAKPGDRVTVQLEKSPLVLFLYLACLRAGFVYHPLNTAYQTSELAYFLGDAEPHIVVCSQGSRELFISLAKASGVAHVLTADADNSGTLVDGASGYSDAFETAACKPDDMAALLYSSGTTGRPKGIMLSHQNLASNGKTLVEEWGFSSADHLLHGLPVFHVHGLFVAIHCVLLSGASMRWLDKFDVPTVLKYLPECTVMMGVPTHYTRLLSDPAFGEDSCVNMRLFVSGSAPLLAETFEQFHARTGYTIIERYGMTETNMNTSNPLAGERRAGTVGPALPGVDVRVVDSDGKSVEAGNTGNLQVRGDNVFQGYWQMPEKTREDFTGDGFFNTGDKASISTDGYVTIVGRSKDMVICGGLNVYPKEIEQLLDGIDGVMESAVIGVPHADFGEAVVAVVVPVAGQSVSDVDIIAFCKTNIANFKVPKRVMVVDELPRNTMGKVQKNVLRERFADCCSSR